MEKLSAKQFREKLESGICKIERYEVEGYLNLVDFVQQDKIPKIFGCVFHDLDLVDPDNNTKMEKEKARSCLQNVFAFVSCVSRLAVSAHSTLPPRGQEKGSINFEWCMFRKPLSLSRSCFKKPVIFKECRFNGYVNLAKSHFSGISFHDCSFDEKVYCEETCFDSWDQTSDVKKDSDTDFSEVTFKDGADFERSVFRGKATFSKAVFYEATTFTGIRFCKGSRGDEPDLVQNMLSLNSAQIFGFVGFRAGVNDNQKKDSLGGQKSGEVNAREGNDSTPRGGCGCDRPDGVSLRVFECKPKKGLEIDFCNIYVQSSRGLRFHSANLERCKLEGTNLDACYFNDVRWPRVQSHTSVLDLRIHNWAQDKSYGWQVLCDYIGFFPSLAYTLWNFPGYMLRGVKNFFAIGFACMNRKPPVTEPLARQVYGVYDHDEFMKKSDISGREEWSNQCARLSKAYRDLKLAYELDKDYIYASDFHFGEKELRRINPEVPWPTKVQLNLFWLINGYGERALRPVGLLLLIILAGAMVYWDGGLSRPREEAYRVSVNGESILDKSEFVVSRSSPRGDGKDWYRCEKTEMCWWESVAYSAATTAFLKPDFLVLPEGFSPARVMSWFQTIAGPALFGMFALAIRNKLKR